MKNNGDDNNIDMGTIHEEIEALLAKLTHNSEINRKVHTLSRLCEKLYEGLKAQSQISCRCYLSNRRRIEKIENKKR